MILDLSKKGDYELASAMRGPDEDAYSIAASDLKWVTTAVLRFYAGVAMDTGAIVNSPEAAKLHWTDLTPEKRDAARRFWDDSSHYGIHLKMGTKALFERLSQENDPRLDEARAYFLYIFTDLYIKEN